VGFPTDCFIRLHASAGTGQYPQANTGIGAVHSRHTGVRPCTLNPCTSNETICSPLSTALTCAGAWAFLIGSYLQLLETLNKHPVSKPGDNAPLLEQQQNGSAPSNGQGKADGYANGQADTEMATHK